MTVKRREQYAAERMAESPDAAEETEFAETQRAYSLLGLENGEVNSSGITAGLLGTIGALYDSRTDEIVILHDGEPLDTLEHSALLAHEYSHALQNRHSPLNTEAVDTHDELLAALAVSEGDAAWTQDRFYALGAERQPEDVDWDPIFQSWTLQSEFYYQRQSSRVRLASRFFIYAFGARYLQTAFEEGGQAAVDLEFADPPQSSSDILLGQKRDRSEQFEDLNRQAIPDLPGAELLTIDRLGWWILSRGSILGEALRARRVSLDRLQWRGDSLSLWARAEDRVPLAALRVRFASASDAEFMSESLRGGTVETQLSISVDGADLVVLATNDAQWLEDLRENAPAFVPFPEETTEEQDSPSSGALAPRLSTGVLWCPRASSPVQPL